MQSITRTNSILQMIAWYSCKIPRLKLILESATPLISPRITWIASAPVSLLTPQKIHSTNNLVLAYKVTSQAILFNLISAHLMTLSLHNHQTKRPTAH